MRHYVAGWRHSVERRRLRPSFRGFARLRGRRRALLKEPAGNSWIFNARAREALRLVFHWCTGGGCRPVTPDTVFRWASLSKGVAADMVASLANDGRLSLDDPVGRRASSLRLPGGNENVATVANLLSHTLGLFGHAQDGKLEDGMDPHYLRGTLATLHNICAPGACHAYQNVAYDAASEIVERVTGRTYGENLHDRFFAPLGMTGASASRDGLLGAPSWARPHVGGHPRGSEEGNEAHYRVPAAGGMNGASEGICR